MRIGEGTVVFVTGGASGLGLATVRLLHSKGATLSVADMNVEALQDLQAELQTRIMVHECDVTEEESVKNAIEKTVEKFGALHAALASAGLGSAMLTYSESRGPLNMDHFKRIIEINLYGSVHVAKYAAMYMSKNKPVGDKKEKGVIIFVSSVAAYEGQKGQLVYSASKAALNGMVMPMARDLGKYGIRACAIAPGIMWSPMSDLMPERVKSRLLADTPLGRMGQPDEFAHFASAIIENAYMNGQHYRLDGAIKFSNL